MARSFSQEPRSDSHKIGETRYRMSHLPSTIAIARTLLLAGILLVVTVLAARSFFPAFAHDLDVDGDDVEHVHLEHDEKDDSQVTAFAATDEDGDNVTWSLEETDTTASPDHGDFEISQDGVLTFMNTPNYEDPAGEGGTRAEQNMYQVVVIARDDDTESPEMDTITVFVEVQNIDEPGEIELSTLQPKEGRAITVALTDHDEQRDSTDGDGDTTLSDDPTLTDSDPGNDNVKWQWARCSTMDVATCVDIEENSTSTSYTATTTDRGHYIRVTAKYADKQTPAPETGEELELNKIAHAMSAHPVVRSDYVPEPPLFPGQAEAITIVLNGDDFRTTAATTSRDIAEDSAARTAVGAPVTAMDEGADGNQEVLTYTLSGTDVALYEIDSATGQIRLSAGGNLDYEENAASNPPDPDIVIVRATDPTDKYSEVTVTINITNVDEDPLITDRSDEQTSIVRREDVSALAVGNRYAATDPEDDRNSAVNLSWSLTGNDRARFDVDNTGQVTFKEAPDFDSPTDSGRNNVYNFTVVVTDSAGNTDSLPVAVTIGNFNEGGSVSLLFNGLTPDTLVQEARVGTTIRAKLIDEDGVSNVRYEWQRGGTAIAGATSATYRPATTTGGSLGVVVTYNDPFVSDINLPSPTVTVSERPASNDAPEIEEPSPALTVSETANSFNTTLTATDDESDTYSWAITGGRDRALFNIIQTSGRIDMVAGVELDHETKPTLQLTVRATDPSAASDSITLTITVTDEQENPVITSAPESPVNYREDQTGPVGTFTATDPEDDNARPRLPLKWSVDDDDFSIDNRGVLRFVSQPDFEAAEADNDYDLRITVTDNTTDSNGNPAFRTGTASLAVNVVNVDEAGEVTLDALAPKNEVPIRATLTDPDDDLDDYDWRWERSTSRNGPWTHSTGASSTPAGANTRDYTPNDEDVGHYLRAFVIYTDGQSDGGTATKTASVVSANLVRDVDYANTAPVFPGQEMDTTLAGVSRPVGSNATTSREIAENSPAGTRVGAAVAAVDQDESRQQQVLTYTIGDSGITGALPADDDLFSINRATGQITVTADDTLNYEDPNNDDHLYIVRVTATDPSGLTSSSDVTIMVTDVKEAPEIDEVDEDEETNLAATSTAENTVADPATTTVLSTYTASDDEDTVANSVLKWSLSGADADMFSLCQGDTEECLVPNANTVSLRFKEAVNYEAPADSGGNNVYDVIVTATDSDMMSDTRRVAVTVTNAEEAGTVMLSNLQPEIGTPITASLTDPDGGVTGLTWQWHWATTNNANADWNLIRGATTNTYTPVASDQVDQSDAGDFLRATAIYNDRVDNPEDDTDTADTDESKDYAEQPSANETQEEPTTNATPQFSDQDPNVAGKQTVRYIQENSADKRVVLNQNGVMEDAEDGNGASDNYVQADDADGAVGSVPADVLTYTLSGRDETSFEIDMTNGEISVEEGTELNYESKSTYTVVVTATDSSLASDSITVTINVVDMNEAPVIMERGLNVSGPASLTHEEEQPASTVVATYSATGPDSAGATLRLEGTDSNLFTLAANGDLTFNRAPDFEAPTDQGGDNVYNVTVRATMGTLEDTQRVTITVDNVDEPGTVSIAPVQATYRIDDVLSASLDEEDEETVTGWQWARSTTAGGTFTPIGGATNDTYTIVEDDIDNFLQVTVTYDDPLGTGKTLSAVTGSAVASTAVSPITGTVTLNPAGNLVSGASVTAMLSDDNTPVDTSVSWVWERSADGVTNWAAISGSRSTGSTSATYATTDADAGHYLRATATYEDASGPTQSANRETTSRVAIHRYDDNSDGTIQIGEAIRAVQDFFNPAVNTTIQEAIRVVQLYFAGLS